MCVCTFVPLRSLVAFQCTFIDEVDIAGDDDDDVYVYDDCILYADAIEFRPLIKSNTQNTRCTYEVHFFVVYSRVNEKSLMGYSKLIENKKYTINSTIWNAIIGRR